MRAALLILFALLAAACSEEAEVRLSGEGPEVLAALAVPVENPDEPDTLATARSVFFADREGAYYYDALTRPQDDPAMGLVVGGFRVLDGWRWWLDADSTALGPLDRVTATVRPDFAIRTYQQRDTTGFFSRLINNVRGAFDASLAERITPLEGPGALLVEVPDSIGTVAFRPVFGDRSGASEYQTEARGPTLLVARGNYLEAREGDPRPVWLAIRAEGGSASTGVRTERPEAGRRNAFGLGEVAFPTPGRLVIATGSTAAEADSLAGVALRGAERAAERRSQRLADLLETAPLTTEDDATNDAIAWARLTLDALTVKDSTGVTVAPGLPGAEPIPGRSLLAGLDAWLLTGDWERARALLTTYGRAQLFDERIDILGRAPNLVRPGGRAEFSTSDATPIYLAAIGDYVRATGDRGLISGSDDFWFKTVFAMRGIYNDSRRHGRQVTSEGFLSAPDGGTWMQSPTAREGLATPRGGAPIEGQGSLYRALRALTDFAQIMGVSQRESGRWYADSANALLRDIPARFIAEDRIADRLDRAGQPDASLRPSAFFALRDLDLPADQKARLARALASRLAYPYGVGTRPQNDSLFHPFLDAPASYSREEALYNGPVWTWLSAPLVTLFAETGASGFAADLWQRQAGLVTETGAVGAIPEILDAHPHSDDRAPIAGAAPVQPWSLTGFLGNAYGDLAGIGYADGRTLVLEPHLPEAWGETVTRARLGSGWVGLTMEQEEDGLALTVAPEGDLPEDAAVRVRALGHEASIPLVRMQGDTLAVAVEAIEVEVTPQGVEVDGEVVETQTYERPDAAVWDGFAFAQPRLQSEYPVMRQAQEQRRLTDGQVLRDNPLAQPILTQTDPTRDDWGATSTYTYPADFPARILDATYLEVAEDDSTTYFRAEFADLAETDSAGFQPTFVAIAIDSEEGGERRIERGASYDFPRGEGYEYVIFIGDGLVVEDAGGRVLGEVAPGRGTAFDPPTGSIAFALPRFVLPDVPRNATVVLLVGAREPGGGVGAFRPVERGEAGTRGGGKVNARDPNVYDVISATVSR